MKTVAVVQARMGSTRLPGKVLMSAAGRPMLGHLLERLARCRSLDAVWVATSDLPQDDAIADFCRHVGTPCHRGSEQDVLSRYAAVLRLTQADHLVRITGDCPLMDPAVVDAVVQEHLSASAPLRYTSNVFPRTYPRGMDVEVISGFLMEELDRQTLSLADREHVTTLAARGQIGAIESQTVRTSPNLSAFRFTLDYPKDAEQIRTLIESGLPGYGLDGLMSMARSMGLDARDNHEEVPFNLQALSILSPHPLASRVVLGSAPFGMFYGRFNREGVPSPAHIQGILRGASELGIRSIETSTACAETVRVLARYGREMQAFTTMLILPPSAEEEHAEFMRCREQIPAAQMDSVVVSSGNFSQSLQADHRYAQLLGLKKDGLVRQVGFWARDAHEALRVNQRWPMDVCVLELHVLDRRALDEGLLEQLAKAGVRICAHSVFKQGLLFVDPDRLPLSLQAVAPALRRFQAQCAQAGIEPAHAALHHVLSLPGVSQVILNVETRTQLEDLFARLPNELSMNWADWPVVSEDGRRALDWSD